MVTLREMFVRLGSILLPLALVACSERATLSEEAARAADAICACVTPTATVDELVACEAAAWQRYEAAEIALNRAKVDDGPAYAKIHARRLACQSQVTQRELELSK